MSTKRATLTIRVEWDADDWELTYGALPAEQRHDVETYIMSLINGSAAAGECGLRTARDNPTGLQRLRMLHGECQPPELGGCQHGWDDCPARHGTEH